MLYDPIKSLGQNFLLGQSVSEDMVKGLGLQEGDTVVEVGSGLGALTVTLIDHRSLSTLVYAVEIDERFVGKLKTMFFEESGFRVVHADILDWLPQFDAPPNFKVIGSLPYYITSPILHALVKKVPQPSLCVLLIQKEVAEKVSAPQGQANYLSSFIQTFFDVDYMSTVKKELFDPVPKVDGGIIKLTRKESPLLSENVEKYEKFLHKGFSHPRKMLNKPFTKEELLQTGVDGKLRPQDLSPQKWVSMFKALSTRL